MGQDLGDAARQQASPLHTVTERTAGACRPMQAMTAWKRLLPECRPRCDGGIFLYAVQGVLARLNSLSSQRILNFLQGITHSPA